MNLEAQKRAPIYEALERFRKKRVVPVVAANRVGEERVEPCEENAGQKSSLLFYGSSFITDGCGEIQATMGREEEGFITADFDLDRLMEDRLSWGLFRDRRPEMYGKICSAV